MYEYRLHYIKRDALRYISHLDLMRAFERALRRAELPVAHTEGFHPHPKLGLGPAMPLGVESMAEYLDMTLLKEFPVRELEQRLNQALPPELSVRTVVPITQRVKPLTAVINRATYTYDEIIGGNLESLTHIMEELWEKPELWVARRAKDGGEKQVDIRPLWHSWKVAVEAEGVVIEAEFEIGSGGTVRPDELVRFLPEGIEIGRITRNGLWIVNEKGRFLPTDLVG